MGPYDYMRHGVIELARLVDAADSRIAVYYTPAGSWKNTLSKLSYRGGG